MSDNYKNILWLLLVILSVAWMSEGCARTRFAPDGEAPPGPGGCGDQSECEVGFLCVYDECVPIEQFNCKPDQLPVVMMTPASVEFGEVVMGDTGTETLLVENVGPCNLTVESAGIGDSGSPGFRCSPCDPSVYPKVVAPGQAFPIELSYVPVEIGEASANLFIRTDDETAGERGLFAVPLHASYSGIPVLQIDPPELNFGFVPYTAGVGGETRVESVRVTNRGTGNATLAVEVIYLRPGTDFSLGGAFDDISPISPRLLGPYDENNPDTWIDVPVSFTPTHNADQETTLVVQARGVGDAAEDVVVSTRLAASSLGPPRIIVNPTELEFRDPRGEPLNLGRTEYRHLTVHNEGQSELTLDLGLDDPSGDFTFSPAFVAPLLPGATVALNVLYNPSAPSDAANPAQPTTPTDAYLRIVSNDTDNILTTVNLLGWARTSEKDDILRLEMTFENSDGGWAQNDFRNVDLELVSPFGYSCKKPISNYTRTPEGNYAITNTTDFCQMWTDTGLEGQVHWIPGGVYEEPERIILYGLGQALADGQHFEVKAHYVEDCANVPTGIVADLAGIGVSALLGILGGQVGVPITIPPDQIGGLIENNCWSHKRSKVTVMAFINGDEVFSQQVTLNARGDVGNFFRVRRENGAFFIDP